MVKLIILGGFLGSGKTSLLLQLARHVTHKNLSETCSVVIVENEIGEVGIDDKLLRAQGYQVENMFSGCVCCTMSGEVSLSVYNLIRDFHPDYIIMEATGVAYPLNIKENLEKSLKIDCGICCVVDVKRWDRLRVPMANLLYDQLKGARVIVLNKTDTVDSETLQKVESSVRQINSSAKYIPISAAGEIEPAILDLIISEVS